MKNKHNHNARCLDCNKKLKNHYALRCGSCGAKERTKDPKKCIKYVDGRSLQTYFCKDCNKKIVWQTAIYGESRCPSCANKGINNPGYVHGNGISEYPASFSEELKAKIKDRDDRICWKCGIKETEHLIKYNRKLSIHHIDYNKDNCNKENLITLCAKCNSRVNKNRGQWTEIFNLIININKEYLWENN